MCLLENLHGYHYHIKNVNRMKDIVRSSDISFKTSNQELSFLYFGRFVPIFLRMFLIKKCLLALNVYKKNFIFRSYFFASFNGITLLRFLRILKSVYIC